MSIQDNKGYREIAQGFSDSASAHIELYSQKYYGKSSSDLNNEENQHIDDIGLFGCIDWLEENGFEIEGE